jgi:hypothetical protein
MEHHFLFAAVAYWQLCAVSVWRPTRRSVLFRQHDGDNALGDRISWVGQVRYERLVAIIDLEKDRLAIDLKRPKIVFLIWVVGVAEIIVHV